MLARLFLLFTVVPLVELYLLVSLGQLLGTGATIGLVLLTGLVGAALARREGLRVLTNWQQSVAAGQLPADGITSGLLVLVGGVLLITPGVVTDFAGLALLVPPIRRRIAAVIERRAKAKMITHTISTVGAGGIGVPPGFGGFGPGPMGNETGQVIDVDAVVTKDESEPG